AGPARGARSLLGTLPPPQHLEPQRQRRTEPEGKPGMVGDAVTGERMHEDIKPLAVEHQPGNERRELLGREGYLIHRDGMRPDRLVVPASQPSLEAVVDPCAQA